MALSIADTASPDSVATRLRRKRFAQFLDRVSDLPKPVRILDVGGTQRYWELVGLTSPEKVSITILNITKMPTSLPNFVSVIGDARRLAFGDKSFDVVFSNSVIEHVGGLSEQAEMAREVRRVGKRYFVQTPNRHFPIEPHFLFPLFQFLPLGVRIWLVRHFSLGWYRKTPDEAKAREIVESVQLLSRKQFVRMFPGDLLLTERFLGFAKSFTICGGW